VSSGIRGGKVGAEVPSSCFPIHDREEGDYSVEIWRLTFQDAITRSFSSRRRGGTCGGRRVRRHGLRLRAVTAPSS